MSKSNSWNYYEQLNIKQNKHYNELKCYDELKMLQLFQNYIIMYNLTYLNFEICIFSNSYLECEPIKQSLIFTVKLQVIKYIHK